MDYRNTLILFRTSTCYVVDFINTPHKHDIYRKFGSTIVQTPFARDANPDVVVAAIRKGNPEYAVRIVV